MNKNLNYGYFNVKLCLTHFNKPLITNSLKLSISVDHEIFLFIVKTS